MTWKQCVEKKKEQLQLTRGLRRKLTQVIAGTLVHTECRRKYTKPEKRDNPAETDSASD